VAGDFRARRGFLPMVDLQAPRLMFRVCGVVMVSSCCFLLGLPVTPVVGACRIDGSGPDA